MNPADWAEFKHYFGPATVELVKAVLAIYLLRFLGHPQLTDRTAPNGG